MKKWFVFFLITLLCSRVFFSQQIRHLLHERKPVTFSFDKIALDTPEKFPEFALPDLSAILQQPFFFLGRGEETLAFLSQDGHFVIKFFLLKAFQGEKRYTIPNIIHWLFPKPHQERQKLRQKVRRQKMLDSMKHYAEVVQGMQKETGTIALHLNPTTNRLPTLVFFDHIGEKHLIELDRVSFVLQHKAVLTGERIANAKTQEEKKKLVQALEDFFVLRAKKGVKDLSNRRVLEKNFGFLGDEVIQFDVGRSGFSKAVQDSPEEEIQNLKIFLQQWASGYGLVRDR
ncbi:MAG: hypothetical protein Q8L98_08780 [Chlamydiales bacterium]|nr:hypothetical protein [Chlamydiales bacterium]